MGKVVDTGGSTSKNQQSGTDALKNHTNGNGDKAKGMHDAAVTKAHSENKAANKQMPVTMPDPKNDD